jgi:hypothetical protein
MSEVILAILLINCGFLIFGLYWLRTRPPRPKRYAAPKECERFEELPAQER